MFTDIKWVVMLRRPYSTIVTPSDCYLFWSLQNVSREKEFSNKQKTQSTVPGHFRFYEDEIEKLFNR